MLTNHVYSLNKEHNDKRDVPIDEEIYKGIFITLIIFGVLINLKD